MNARITLCIPVFNQSLLELLKALDPIPPFVHLLVADDASTHLEQRAENQQAVEKKGGTFLSCPTNLGRWHIRKFLAHQAPTDWLLFLDADMFPPDAASFFLKYADLIQKYPDLVAAVGGRSYGEPPSNLDFLLHYRYGQTFETASQVFLTSNVLLKKEAFSPLTIPPLWLGYGHEDSFLQAQLIRLFPNKKILYRCNPAVHQERKSQHQFLQEQQQATKNLVFLYVLEELRPILIKQIRLLSFFETLKKYRLLKVVQVISRQFQPWISRKLKQPQTPLFFLQWQKFIWFSAQLAASKPQPDHSND